MSDNTTSDGDAQVFNFPRIGFRIDPGNTLPPAPADPTPATPAVRVGRTVGEGRLSPLDALNALPDPGLTQPVIPTTVSGSVPATFRSEPAPDLIGPRLGALSLAAILAVAVAALRGAHTAFTAYRTYREGKQADDASNATSSLASSGSGKKNNGKGGGRKVPSSSDWGGKTLGGGGRSGGRKTSSGTRSGGPGGGKKNGSGTSTGTGSAGGGRKHRGPSSKNSGTGPGRSKGGTGSGSGSRRQKPLHRTSQGGGAGLKKHGNGSKDTKQRPGNGSRGGSLTKDLQKAAARRLKRRLKNGPTSSKRTNGQKNSAALKKTPTGNTQKKTGGPDLSQVWNAAWRDTKKAARRRWKRRQDQQRNAGVKPPLWKTPKNTGPQTPKPKGAKQQKGRRLRWERIRAYARRNQPGPGTGGNRGTSGGHTGPTGARRSPFENAGQATGATQWTAERADYPGAQAKRWEPAAVTTGQPSLPATGPAALDTAPTPHTRRPSTSRPPTPRPMPPAAPVVQSARIQEARAMAAQVAKTVTGGQMDAQHATEITLDDALDEYGVFKDDAFKTHDQCHKLAARAINLRDTLTAFAQDLAVNHNLIGLLFSGAMARLAETMDLVARMAEEMETSSLQAAEEAESADNDLNDAYRPITQATADAGLTTPSAPIHNQT